jgi:hypothetical protein
MNSNEPTITVNENTTLEEIIAQLDQLGLIEPPKQIEYEFRWYYDNTGHIFAACPNQKEADMYGITGDYIVVTQEMYPDILKYTVQNRKPVLRMDNQTQSTQLEKSDKGFTVAKNNAAILLEPDENYNQVEHYDYKNN